MNRTLVSYQQLGLSSNLGAFWICHLRASTSVLSNGVSAIVLCGVWDSRQLYDRQMRANRLDCAWSGQQFYHPWSPFLRSKTPQRCP